MIIVTHNQNKYMEYEEMFFEKGMELEWFNYEYPEIQSDSLKEIAEFSMKYVSKLINKPFFLEDTGLFISTLNGFPGPYSSYVQSKIGNKGILKLLEGADDRNAKFISIIGFFDGKDFHFFEGVLNGQISLEEKGKNGFGYDPIFVPNGKNKTLAEMDISEKNAISHRKNALDKMIDYLRKNILY